MYFVVSHLVMVDLFFFFFSSRRRHTRLTCDWSSDVCSSDLRSSGRTGGRRRGVTRCGPRDTSRWSGNGPASSSTRTSPRPSSNGSSPTEVSRSEEHTSELQSHVNLVCRLLLEKKNHTCVATN